MEMAVKVIDINHIDHRPHNMDARRMQTVSKHGVRISCVLHWELVWSFMFHVTKCLMYESQNFFFTSMKTKF